jgi:hypothetical protein
VALVCILPFVIPAVIILATGTTNAYLAMFLLTLIPSVGLGFVLYGFMDRMVDYIFGPAPIVAQSFSQVKDQSEMKLYILKV